MLPTDCDAFFTPVCRPAAILGPKRCYSCLGSSGWHPVHWLAFLHSRMLCVVIYHVLEVAYSSQWAMTEPDNCPCSLSARLCHPGWYGVCLWPAEVLWLSNTSVCIWKQLTFPSPPKMGPTTPPHSMLIFFLKRMSPHCFHTRYLLNYPVRYLCGFYILLPIVLLGLLTQVWGHPEASPDHPDMPPV